jgi:hypothetical protein
MLASTVSNTQRTVLTVKQLGVDDALLGSVVVLETGVDRVGAHQVGRGDEIGRHGRECGVPLLVRT